MLKRWAGKDVAGRRQARPVPDSEPVLTQPHADPGQGEVCWDPQGYGEQGAEEEETRVPLCRASLRSPSRAPCNH